MAQRGMVLPHRNPIITVKMLVTLDVLSGGRVILGAGVGWMPEEFAALGASYAHRGGVTCPVHTDVLEERTVRHSTAPCRPLCRGRMGSYTPPCGALTMPVSQGHMRPPQVQVVRR